MDKDTPGKSSIPIDLHHQQRSEVRAHTQWLGSRVLDVFLK
jgi:hypothetical protein